MSYLENMWSDMAFLDQNLFLKKVAPELELSFNPLLLARRSLYENIHILRTRFGRKGAEGGLDYLKGRTEQVSDAITAGSLVKKPGDITLCQYDLILTHSINAPPISVPYQPTLSIHPITTTIYISMYRPYFHPIHTF